MFNPSELCHCTSDNVLLLISIINLLFWSFFLVWELFLSSAYFFLICTEFWNVNKRELQKTFFFFFLFQKVTIKRVFWLIIFQEPCFVWTHLDSDWCVLSDPSASSRSSCRWDVSGCWDQHQGADPVMLRLTALICIIRCAFAKEQSFNSVWQESGDGSQTDGRVHGQDLPVGIHLFHHPPTRVRSSSSWPRPFSSSVTATLLTTPRAHTRACAPHTCTRTTHVHARHSPASLLTLINGG